MDEEYLKKLVVTRLRTIPPDVSFSIGDYGSFTRDQLIQEVEKGSKVGKAAEEMELNFLRKMPHIAKMIE
ncbi:MAG: hypothetical protein HYW50_00570 [Candidatus Diapherotrites archaeon]|nr:hypothetical protein [Candidatus Diapherotrites archaeon]